MFSHPSVRFAVILLAAGAPQLAGQINVTGVTDKAAPYVNTVTFTIGTQAGYSYGAFLNSTQIPVGVPVTLNTPDYYELQVFATNVTTAAVTNRLVRFIVRASARGGTEWGLPTHTPSPVIPSAAAEFAGARLQLIAPQDFPAGYEIPVVVWVLNDAGHAVRANGSLAASGHPAIGVKRGVGSGFLSASHPSGMLDYAPQLQGLQTNKSITLEAATSWTAVAGTQAGATVWPDGARIQVTGHLSFPSGSSLTIGAGAIVLLNPGVNITNSGSITINGTTDRPVVFMPQSRAQPWGGFFMRTSAGVFNATGTIFVRSGADPNGGAGHRPEQCLFLVDNAPRLTLTDSAAIDLAGQLGHAFNGGTFNFTRFLMQGATTGGEYTGANFTVNDSAFIDCPDASANYVDGDNDALYFVSGRHAFTNTLIGWTKDDGIDSGGSGYGPLTYQSCWFESIFHEGNSLSGYKDVYARDTVYMDCGQGIENGYNGPTNRMDHCLFLANQVGLRHGDNYDGGNGSYTGRESATNCLSLYNHRDVFGYNWHSSGGWTNATGQMAIIGNWLSTPNSYFPNNTIWNPASDGLRLAAFMSTPPNAAVGVGLAVRTNRFPTTALAQGVPVRLSSYTTNPVSVSYTFHADAVGEAGAGLLLFAPGETLKRIYPAGFNVASVASWNLFLTGASGGELTGLTNVTFEGAIPVPQVSIAVATNVLPGYRITEGIFVRLDGPTAQPVTVNYTNRGNGGHLSSGTISFNPPETIKQFLVTGANPFDYSSIDFTLSNPGDGVTLGGITSVTYTNPVLAVSFGVPGPQADLALLGAGLPVSLNSPAPSGVSVQFQVEGSGSVLTNGTISFAQGESSRLLLTPSINLAQHDLLRATLSNPTSAQLANPSSIYLVRINAAPPATNSTLIPRGAVWRYRDDASAAPAGWQDPGFDDSSWPEGPAQLGFSNGEENDEATLIADNNQITSYFRHDFTVADPMAYSGLSYWLLRDDGGVVYLNGTEIFRSPNLPVPPAAISYSTTTVAPNGENTIDTGTTNRNALRSGANVLAAEIHQQNATSSDVSFNFELIGIGAPPPAPPQSLYYGAFDNRITLAWGDPTLALEEATELLSTNTVWSLVGLASPVSIAPDPGSPQRFFRLRKP